jgi:hypothetical protein
MTYRIIVPISREERWGRAGKWPVMLWRFFWRIWAVRTECEPPLGPVETLSLASMHVTWWVWNYIAEGDIYLPKARLKRLE